MGSPIKNLIFGGGSPPKRSQAAKLFLGDKDKPKRSEAGRLVFGEREKTERKGVSALVFGDNKKPKRSGLAALVFGAGDRPIDRRPSLRHVKYRDLDEQNTEFARNPKMLRKLLSDTYISQHLPKEIRGRNGAVIGQKELRDKIIELAHKQPRGFFGDKPGLTVDKLKKLLRDDRSLGWRLDSKTAERVATVAAYQWYVPPDDGPSEEEKSRRIATSKATSDIIINKQGSIKAQTQERLRRNRGRAQDIGAAEMGKDAVASAAFTKTKKADPPAPAAAPAAEGRAGVAADADKEADKEADKASAARSATPVFIAGGSDPAGRRPPEAQRNGRPDSLGDSNEYFYSPDQVISPHNGRPLDFKKLIEEKKAAEEAEDR